MTDQRSHATTELDELLQFLEMCPVGLVEFDDQGVVNVINPEAVNLLAATFGVERFANLFELLRDALPDLAEIVASSSRAGRILEGRQISAQTKDLRALSLTVVRVSAQRCIAVIADISNAVARASLADEVASLSSATEVAARAASAAAGLLGAAGVSVQWLSSDGVLHVVSTSDGPADLAGSTESGGPGRDALKNRTIVTCHTSTELRGRYPEWAIGHRSGAQAAAAIPMGDGDLGSELTAAFVELWYTHDPGFDRAYVERLESLAGVIEAALRKALAGEILRESETRFQTLFSSIDEGFCLCEIVVDDVGCAIDYRFLEVNPAFEKMTGLSGAAGRTAYELVPDLESHWIETYARVALDGEPIRFEQGSAALGRWFDVYAMPFERRGRFALVFTDHTARREAELALKESEDFTRRVLNDLPGFVSVVIPDGTVVEMNRASLEAAGLSAGDVVGQKLWDGPWWDDESDVPRLKAALAQAARGEEVRYDISVRTSARSRLQVDFQIVPLRDRTGRVTHLIPSGLDVSARVAAEAERDAAQHRIGLMQKLVAALSAAVFPSEVAVAVADMLIEAFAIVRCEVAFVSGTDVHLLSRGSDQTEAGHWSIMALDSAAPVIDTIRTQLAVEVLDESDDLNYAKAGFFVPLPQGAGSLGLWFNRAGPMSPSERSLLEGIGNHVSPALKRALLHEAVELARQVADQARARAELVAELLIEIEEPHGVAARAQRLLELLVPRAADYATIEVPTDEKYLIAIAHRDGGRLETLRALREHHRLGPDDANSMWRASQGDAQLVIAITPEVRSEYVCDDDVSELISLLDPHSHIAVPIDLGGGIRGALMMGLSDRSRPAYGRDDLSFAREIAERAGLVLARARLREQEHDISLRLQHALLPDRLVQHPNLEITARYQAAADALLEVGGDWYDTFTWADGCVGLIVGDVVGHGLGAAAAMGRLRSAVAALAPHTGSSPSALLDALDHFARGPNGTNYATACCAVIDPQSGHLRYAAAGHPPMLVLAPDGQIRRLDNALSFPLCGQPVKHRPESFTDLVPGSIIVAYTDGVFERRNELLDIGLDRLQATLQSLVGESTDGVADGILERMSHDGLVEDDMVLVCLRYLPAVVKPNPQPYSCP